MQQFYDFRIEKIKDLSSEEKIARQKNLDLFYLNGFPSKKDEDWKPCCSAGYTLTVRMR